jgi:hypothetical protein
LRILYLSGFYKPLQIPKIKTFIEENSEYITPLKTKFLKSFSKEKLDFNENINPIFYSKKELNEYLQDSHNKLEKIWKTRILFENTPRGNVIMFYDPYKLGFSFYCDQKVISYGVLNAVAMKYVLTYRCRDFFMDESVVPVENLSKLIEIHFSEEKKNKVSDVKKTFAKLRDYSKENPNSKMKQPQTFIESHKNTFIYLGKTNNFRITQSFPKPKKVLAKFTSPLLDSLEKNAGVQREQMSYKQFKNLQEPVFVG